MSSKKTVHVAVGVIQRQLSNNQREILIAKRHDDAHQGGLWEFPGGKVEPGESLPVALARELEEELGMRLEPNDTDALRPLIKINHDYGDKQVLLDVWLVTHFANAPAGGVGQEGQIVRWVKLEELACYRFPDANVPIISACQLSEEYVITPVYESVKDARQGLTDLLEASSGMILFRQPILAKSDYFSWLDELLDAIPGLGSRLMLSANFAGEPPEETGSFVNGFERYRGRVIGVHFPSSLARQFKKRVLEGDMLMAVSCHSIDELKHAEALQADFVTLSPVQKTSSHPEAEPLGWSRFEDWVKLVAVPVYALGGMERSDMSLSFLHGGQGIAGIRTW